MPAAAFLSGSIVPTIILHENSTLGYSPSSFVRRNDDSNAPTSPEKSSASTSSSVYCRICHEGSNYEELIDPCECSGTLALIHASCLEKWLSTSNTEHCEICKHPFDVQKRNKSVFESVALWWKGTNIHGSRGITGDCVSLAVLTPLCIAAIYLCAIGATAYAKLGFWQGTGLAILCCTLIATYFTWFFSTIRYHYRSWREWRVRNQDIKLLVKHCTEEERTNGRLSIAKATTVRRNGGSHDRNNNNDRSMLAVMRPRRNGFASWFGVNFSYSNDPVFVLEQTTFV